MGNLWSLNLGFSFILRMKQSKFCYGIETDLYIFKKWDNIFESKRELLNGKSKPQWEK